MLVRLVPLLFLGPVGAGLALSLIRLFGMGHPVYGWTTSINADAEAMYLGIWPFQDPADGFTGDAYTPLFPAVSSLFDHLRLWTGWPLLLTILAAVGTAALIAWLTYRPLPGAGRARRVVAIGEAAGLGALAVSFAFGLLRPAVYEARPDHFAWFLGFAGLFALPWASRGSGRAKLTVVLLLTAAFWTKQTAIIASVSALGVVALLVSSRRLAPRAAFAWMGALLALNAAILVALTLATDGWQYRFNFGIGLPVTRSIGDVLPDLLARLAPALAFLAVAAAAAWVAAGKPRAPSLRAWGAGLSERGLVAVALAAMAVLGCAAGVYLRRYAGGDDNNLLPGVLAIGGLAGFAYSRAAVAPVTRTVVAAAAALVFASTLLPGDGKWRLRGGDFVPRPEQAWADLPAGVRAFARANLVWDPLLSDLNVHEQRTLQPNFFHIQEALLRDARPTEFERALLERRFAAVFRTFAPTGDLAADPDVGWEDNYFWKLNQVIALKYEPSGSVPRLPGGEAYAGASGAALVPRAGTDPAPWIARCFGPFQLAGIEMRIRRGGGLWCVPASGRLQLRGTPAARTEVVSADPIERVSGAFSAMMAAVAGAAWRIERDGAWALEARVRPGATGIDLRLSAPGGVGARRVSIDRAELHRSAGLVRIRLAEAAQPGLARRGEDVVAAVPSTDSGGKLHIWATRESDVRFNLKGLRAE